MDTKGGSSNGSSLWNIQLSQGNNEPEVRDDMVCDDGNEVKDDMVCNDGNDNNVPYLDQGIITQIFMRTPIESLYGEFRYVCKLWLDIITNDSALHLYLNQQQQPGILIQYYNPYPLPEIDQIDLVKKGGEDYLTYFFKLGEQGIEERVDLTLLFNNRMRIWSCCNGLTLVSHLPNKSTFYVVNLLTKQRLMLPPAVVADERWASPQLVFFPCTGRYKVVSTIDKTRIEIITLPGSSGGCTSKHNGDDLRWRLIEESSGKLSIWHPPLVINGVLYWPHFALPHIMCFDATAERFYKLPNPDFDPTEDYSNYLVLGRGGFLELGGCLSLMTSRRHWREEQNKVYIWIIKNGGEWIKQTTLNIDNNIMKYRFPVAFSSIFTSMEEPILSFRNGEVMILWSRRHPICLAYNGKTNRLCKLALKCDSDLDETRRLHSDLRFYGSHVNTIVPL